MRKTPKQIAVKHAVYKRFLFRPYACHVCHDMLWLEMFYFVRGGQLKYNICTQCADTKEEAYDLVVKYKITANDICKNNEIKKLQAEIDANRNYKQMIESITRDIIELPDGEVSPSVYSVIVRYIT